MTFSVKPSHQFIDPNPNSVKSEYKSKYAIDTSLSGVNSSASTSNSKNESGGSGTTTAGMTIKTTVTSMEDYY